MSLGMVTYDGTHEFYAEFTDYDQHQMDEWLEGNILKKFTLSEMGNLTFKKEENSFFFKGDTEWVVNHRWGLKNWLKSFKEKIVCAASGNTYDWVLFRSLLKVKYKEELPEYIDGWSIDIISLFRWEGHQPNGEDFKESFIGQQNHEGKHHALVDAHVARKMYLKLEQNRKSRRSVGPG